MFSISPTGVISPYFTLTKKSNYKIIPQPLAEVGSYFSP
jgi:hypothetical protein